MQPHRWQPTRLPHPRDSPGKNTGVGCHFLLQCMKVKSESEVAQSGPTLSNPMDCSLPGSSVHGILQARLLEWGAIAFSDCLGASKGARQTLSPLRLLLPPHPSVSFPIPHSERTCFGVNKRRRSGCLEPSPCSASQMGTSGPHSLSVPGNGLALGRGLRLEEKGTV